MPKLYLAGEKMLYGNKLNVEHTGKKFLNFLEQVHNQQKSTN